MITFVIRTLAEQGSRSGLGAGGFKVAQVAKFGVFVGNLEVVIGRFLWLMAYSLLFLLF